MSWLLSIIVGVLTAVLGGILTGLVASLAVDWYRVPSREGQSGYFVLFLILLALIIGLILGIVVSRQVAARPDPGFLKSLGLSLAIYLSLIGLIGGAARLLADVGPTIGGKSLLLNVEVQWPEGVEPPPDTGEGIWLRLSSASGRTVRVSEVGPMWREDARLDGGQWIVPGAVDLFTSRGQRLITLEPNGTIPSGYVVPLGAWPGRSKLAWSDWMPKQRPGGPPPPNGFRYRFRLVQEDQPLRVQKFGDFEVTTIARSLREENYGNRPRTWSADADFLVHYRGRPVVIESQGEDSSTAGRFEKAEGVAVLPGTAPALLMRVNGQRGSGDIWLVAGAGDSLRTEFVAHGGAWSGAAPLTNDTTLFKRATRSLTLDGRVDGSYFSTPGLYLFENALLDTRTRTVRRIQFEAIYNLVDRINPLALSPDERSFVRLAHDPDSSSLEVLEVFNTATSQRYRLPAERHRLRYGSLDDLDPSHIAHYFAWTRGPDGNDHLVEREQVKPLPYRGSLSWDEPSYREYRVYLAKESLREAMIQWLIAEFKAERVPTEEGRYSQQVRIDGKPVYLSWSEDDEHVGVWMDRGEDNSLVPMIAERFDQALATGRYDGDFVVVDGSGER